MSDRPPLRNVLAFDSAGSSCSVAVAINCRTASVVRVHSPHGQAEILLPMVDRAMGEAGLAPAELASVAVTVGPGSFTGIRVGLAAAQGIALATGAQLIGITSFEAAAAASCGCA
ncbi:MAG TPA: tRNA (adenosine(37)-N6)-threonylcarbamoyltransferase complex dimerization subunit type 1 TsaB, partial [Stellaceae bacterium]|nr:tRNA (adenosine(37)-N6)-threonylcarbamoyltransferase complex dimerization subunit type 1 TsaB [Stellaceae bacterium]